MGVKLGPLLRQFGEEVGISYLEGKKLAIDAYPTIYQTLATVRDRKGRPLRDSNGRVTSHLVGLFNRSAKMFSKGIRPVFVFDGPPHKLKKEEVEKREKKRKEAKKKYNKALKEGEIEKAKKFAQQSIRVEENIEKSAEKLLKLMNIPVIEAPHDAEAQAAHLVKKGKCFGVASPDYDAFLFESSTVVRGLRMTKGVKPKLFKLKKILDQLGISHSQLIYIALLLGTDFNPGGVEGVGQKTALTLVKENEEIEKILSKKDVEWKTSFPSPQRIIRYYQKPPVKENVKIKFGEVDEEAIRDFLVRKHDFSKKRVERRLKEIRERKEKEKKAGLQSSLDQFVT